MIDPDQCGQMEDAFHALQRSRQRIGIGNVRLDKREVEPRLDAVHDAHFISVPEQFLREIMPDKSGTAYDCHLFHHSFIPFAMSMIARTTSRASSIVILLYSGRETTSENTFSVTESVTLNRSW